jgi:hypothetical protein
MSENLVVNGGDFAACFLHIEQMAGKFAAVGSASLGFLGISEGLQHGSGKSFGISRRDEPAGSVLLNKIRQSSNIRCYDGDISLQ